MTEVAMPAGRLHRHTGSISQIETGALLRSAPTIEMMPNPDFSFPALPAPGTASNPRNAPPRHRRPQSMHGGLQAPQPTSLAHRRNMSAAPAALPTFTFNAEDVTGRKDASTPPLTPEELAPHTPSSSHRHKRGGSEFVGGDSRLGVAISSSPTKSSAPPLPLPLAPPTTKRHMHRRSGANSHHDLSAIMHPPVVSEEPRKSSSLPTTPIGHDETAPPFESPAPVLPAETDAADTFGPPSDSSDSRPVSRPRVGFSDNVEFIPRPLSTISSETESSLSTTRGHSVNNSISSVLSLSAPSPPPKRHPMTPLSTTFEDDNQPRARSSVEISKRIEKEGEWLTSGSSQSLKRPLSEPRLSFAATEQPTKQREVHNKKHSFSHALGFDRRKSEPAIAMKLDPASRVSSVSLHDPSTSVTMSNSENFDAPGLDRRPSTKRIRSWAFSKLSKKGKDKAPSVKRSSIPVRPMSSPDLSVPGRVPISEAPAAETDLDAVLGGDMQSESVDTTPQPRMGMGSTQSDFRSNVFFDEADSENAVVDLDAALGPMMTPPLGSQKPRRELHSSRGTKDFSGLGMHYHRRAESAPELPPFSRGSVISTHSLQDVFEDEAEEETDDERPVSSESSKFESFGTGVHVVDTAEHASETGFSENGLRIRSGEWELERPTTSYGHVGSRLSTPGGDRRPSSIVAETIFEETSPVEPVQAVEIVPAEDEPRASSLTKSSDSSETPTVMAPQAASLLVPDGVHSLMTPDTYQTSTFSSPDFTRRQGSFDNSRVGTAASSITDNRTISSCAGDNPNRVSVDDVPSLTSSRSTMMSTMHPNSSHREFNMENAPPLPAEGLSAVVAAERRRKRASIQSLSQLVGNSFSGKTKAVDDPRPQTAVVSMNGNAPKKEHRLKKLMFWRSKSKQSLNSIS
ncbi:hypothetical protein LTR78_006631 [Recurvomyces mirabilis]|uniref:Cell wall proline rich protein n=1 Tax=Recurvomyces mirabilis TaxID=574656 RepID=A0AAE0WKK1_9PEZI|nr:hypothetical protein LTR78_006631 [Recurvomyces mirabilis]KAK5151478.1 hypothetical protein LTS14_009322 [Recurvomyces mirabilis]